MMDGRAGRNVSGTVEGGEPDAPIEGRRRPPRQSSAEAPDHARAGTEHPAPLPRPSQHSENRFDHAPPGDHPLVGTDSPSAAEIATGRSRPGGRFLSRRFHQCVWNNHWWNRREPMLAPAIPLPNHATACPVLSLTAPTDRPSYVVPSSVDRQSVVSGTSGSVSGYLGGRR